MHDLAELEKELAKKEYAAVLTEGGGAHMGGQIPWNLDFIHQLSSLSKKYGTVWIIDEVVTGFRDAPGGWQSIVELRPDLTTLGKCVSGGLAVGAVVGRSEIFEAFNPNNSAEKRVRHTGTWNANPLLCAAGVAACKLYLNGEPQKTATECAAYLREQGNKAIRERNISGCLYGRTIIHIYMGPFEFETDDPFVPPTNNIKQILNPEMSAVKGQLCLHMLHRGVDTLGGRLFIMSAAHRKADIDETIDVFGLSLDAMLSEGLIMRV
jgi:glutamate-1-semialdehyde 2,1-aminomutase